VVGDASVGGDIATEKGCPSPSTSVGAGDNGRPGAVVTTRMGILLANDGAGVEGRTHWGNLGEERCGSWANGSWVR
jgi:hypothetical protein